jgi:hypothetical protein
MDRRTFVKLVPLTVGAVAVLPSEAQAKQSNARTPKARARRAAEQPTSRASGGDGYPAWVKSMRESDMDGMGPDGRPVPGYRATGT